MIDNPNELPEMIDDIVCLNENLIPIPSKNKWLYPDDEFGQMQKGVVINDKVYRYEIVKEIKNSTDT